MIDEYTEDLLAERLIRRTEEANEYFLKKIGASIKQIRDLTPSQAHQLVQILKYGGEYDDIVQHLMKYTDLNAKELDEIFEKYAKKDRQFYKKFYKYRNIPFTPFEQNTALKSQTMAISNMAKNEMYNFTRSNVIGYSVRDTAGKLVFKGLREVYNDLLDTALLNVGQGKETFDSAMYRILKDVGESGLKTLDFESGRSIRLDSAIRMHLSDRLRQLHNENQKIIGEEFDFDGFELSVHINPAIDHEDAQGKQFSIAEYEKLNSGEEAVDYKGRTITLDPDGNGSYRPISTLNCKHKIYTIILGVDEPEYSDEALKKIIEENEKGFMYKGKHYTNYEGTQIQRRIETEIRKQKDLQILAKSSDNGELVSYSQEKITKLTKQYKELCDISGLQPRMDRMRVSGYKRTAVKKK